MKTHLLIASLSFATVFVADAQDAARIKPDPPSSFLSTLGGRNPFWPIGFKPNSGSKPQQVKQNITIDKFPDGTFRISSILLGNPPIAVINGQECEPGDLIRVSVGGATLNVLLSAIGDGYIRVSYEGRDYLIDKY